MKKTTIALLLMFALPASALPEVECSGIYRNRTTGEGWVEKLYVSDIDPLYRSVTMNDYEVGADYSYLPQGGIGLIVYNNKTHRFTSVTSGFRRIGKTKVMEADLKLYDVSEKGEDIVVGLQCNYIEP